MIRPKTWAALLLSLLMLAACSSGKPAGAGAGHVGNVVHIGRYTLEFTGPPPGNGARAAVMRDFRRAQVLWMRSEVARHLARPARQYVTGHALRNLIAVIHNNTSRHLVPAGTDRFFLTQITSFGSGHATVSTCDDGSAFKEENPRTGLVDTAYLPTPGEAYLFETWRMSKVSGHWAITAVSSAELPHRSAEHCQPGMAHAAPPRRPTVTALLRRMNAVLQAARSVRVSGTIRRGGKTLTMNLGLTRSGDVSGRVFEQGAGLTVVTTHGHSYIKLSPSFLRLSHLPAGECGKYCGKYLELPAQQSRAMLAHLSLSSITHSMTSVPASTVTCLGAVVAFGQPAWLLQDSHRNSIYVARRGTPYVLGGVTPPPSLYTLRLSDWNAVRIPGPPPPGQVVHLPQLVPGPQPAVRGAAPAG